MKLERLEQERIPADLSQYWQDLQDAVGAGHLHTEIGQHDEHQKLRLVRVVELAVEYGHADRSVASCFEVGCCEGSMTELLAPYFHKILAVDFVQSLLDVCPELHNVIYSLHDIAVWTPTMNYDVMVIGEVLEHLVDPIEVLKRLGSRCRYVVASCPVNEELQHTTGFDVSKIRDLHEGKKVGIGEGAGHIWAMDMEGFEYMFKAAGYDLVHTETLDVAGIVVAKSNHIPAGR